MSDMHLLATAAEHYRRVVTDSGSLSRCTDKNACWGVDADPCPLHSPRAYAKKASKHRA